MLVQMKSVTAGIYSIRRQVASSSFVSGVIVVNAIQAYVQQAS